MNPHESILPQRNKIHQNCNNNLWNMEWRVSINDIYGSRFSECCEIMFTLSRSWVWCTYLEIPCFRFVQGNYMWHMWRKAVQDKIWYQWENQGLTTVIFICDLILNLCQLCPTLRCSSFTGLWPIYQGYLNYTESQKFEIRLRKRKALQTNPLK